MGVFGRRGLNRCSFPPTSCCRPKISDFRDLEVPSALRRVVGRSPIFRDDETAKPSRTTLRSLALAPLSSRGSAARTVRGALRLASKMWIESHRQSEALPSLRSLRSRRPRHLLRRFLGPLTRLRLVRGAVTDAPPPDRDGHTLPSRFLRSGFVLAQSSLARTARFQRAPARHRLQQQTPSGKTGYTLTTQFARRSCTPVRHRRARSQSAGLHRHRACRQWDRSRGARAGPAPCRRRDPSGRPWRAA